MIESLDTLDRGESTGQRLQNICLGEEGGVELLSDDEQDVWYLLKDIVDPEFPYTLGMLRVVIPKGLSLIQRMRYEFLPSAEWKLYVAITKGYHNQENELNKLFLDKERVSAAMENPNLAEFITLIDMDSYSNRASSLFTTFTTALFVVACLNHLSYYFNTSSPTGSITVHTETIEFSEYKHYRSDQVRFDFDLSYDLSSEYNWNVNQLYLYVVASYETGKNEKNEIVVYDKIIQNKADYQGSIKNVKNKYFLRDEFKNTLNNAEVTLSIKYQVMPIFGILQNKEVMMKGGNNVLQVPSVYNVKQTKK